MTTTAAKTILVVDDENDLRDLIGSLFKMKGWEVLTAGSGTEALEILKSAHVDAVVSDVRMPNGDGISLLEGIRAKNPASPVVILTTGFADVTRESAIAKGAAALLHKPFDFKRLLELVTKQLLP